MITTITVDDAFIAQRDHRATIYNPYSRSQSQLKKAIECELYEYDKIKKGQWKDDDRWEIDGHCPFLGPVDVKCIRGYYNIERRKLLHMFAQQGIIKFYYFIEWLERPSRLLRSGDVVKFKDICSVPYKEALSQVKVSFKTFGYYLDVRKLKESYNNV